MKLLQYFYLQHVPYEPPYPSSISDNTGITGKTKALDINLFTKCHTTA